MALNMKKRLDSILVERGVVSGRDRAAAAVMAGLVYIGGEKEIKPGRMFDEDVVIEYRGEREKYKSRGGYKLEKALDVFGITLSEKTSMDIGASTGGFTDCILQNGAKLVYAVDVGYGQLAWELRNNERVVNMERTNIRYLEDEKLNGAMDFISIDVSFISLKLVLPMASRLLCGGGECVCLIKPQFEAGRGEVGKGGVVKDVAIHKSVIEKVIGYAFEAGFGVCGLSYSPIKGPKGNVEYLLYIKKGSNGRDVDIDGVVAEAHLKLGVRN